MSPTPRRDGRAGCGERHPDPRIAKLGAKGELCSGPGCGRARAPWRPVAVSRVAGNRARSRSRGERFLPSCPPPKTNSRPRNAGTERHRLNVLGRKTFGEIIPRSSSPAVASGSRARTRGENLAGKGLERRGLRRLRACACGCARNCCGLSKISLKPLGSKEAGSAVGRREGHE